MFKSKTDEIMKELERQGKITILTDAECNQIRLRINEQMVPYRHELARKQAQSHDDTHKIILNA